jgi:hypothetical protein
MARAISSLPVPVSQDENGGLGRRDLGDLGEHPPKRLGRPDDLFEHGRAIDLFAQLEILAPGALLGTLAIIDVGSGGIPAADIAGGIANRVVADQEPPVLPVFAACALLGFERLSAQERLLAILLELGHIIRMEPPDPRAVAAHLIWTQAQVVLHELVCPESAPIRAKDGDGVGNGVERTL